MTPKQCFPEATKKVSHREYREKKKEKNENDSRKGKDRLMALLIALRFDPGVALMTKMMMVIMNDDDVVMVTVPKKSDARYMLVNNQVIYYIACPKNFSKRKKEN